MSLRVSRRELLLMAATIAVPPIATSPSASAMPQVRQSSNLDAGWRFLRGDAPGAQASTFNDSSWSAVNVPHTWNAQDGQDGGNNYYRGIGWYRTHVTPSATLAGKKLWLQFDGASAVADVWVNGTHLGTHQGAFATFRFDATNVLKLGQDNVVAVRVNNAPNPDIPPLVGDFTVFGGIYRDVSLVVVDPLSVRMDDFAGPGVYLAGRSVTAASASVDVTTKVSNHSATARQVQVRTTVTDASGKVVATSTTAAHSVAAAAGLDSVQNVVINSPHRWQGKADPYMYQVSVAIVDAATGQVTDTVSQPLGLRSATVDADNGFFLNGQHLSLHGVNAHQDHLNKGWAVTPAQHVQDFDLMDEMGVNALRTAHYQQAQQVYDLADQRGYVVWVEIPLVGSVTDSAAFRANAQQQLSELIRQNFNHPSIFFWGIGNEQANDNTVTNGILTQLANQVRAEDPTRLSTYANDKGDTSGLGYHTDVIGFNRYYGWYQTGTGPAAWADALHAKEPTRKFGISEYGAGASVNQHQESPPQPVPASHFHPEEYQSRLHETYWTQISTRPYLWGTFVWNMFDFASDGRAEGDTNGRNDKGLVTYDRGIRKDAFYWYKANWTHTSFVYITSRRWTQRTAAATTVKVYATADLVTLSLNGKVISAKTSANHIYTWPITLAPGQNVVAVTGTRGGQAFTDTATWILA